MTHYFNFRVMDFGPGTAHPSISMRLAHEAKFESEELKVKEDEQTRLLQLAQEQDYMPHRTCASTFFWYEL